MGTEYSAWATAREESYQREGIRKLTSQETSLGVVSPDPGLWKRESWRFAVGETLRAQGWEAEVALIERIPQTVAPSRFVPIRFVANNRLSASDKITAAFEALSLAKVLVTKTGTAKIVHGEKRATLSVNASALSRAVHRKVSQVASLLSAAFPPDTVVNRHCPECGFHERCRKDVVGKDDLSLLSNLTEKERARYRNKGIFTVSQLAYTFRPRRRSKRLAARPERYHHALKALAIRERKIHVVGKPELPMDGTPVFLDVEGLRMPANRHTRFDVKATKFRDKSQFNGEGYVLSLLETLYFLEPSKNGGRSIEFTGLTLMKHLDEALPNCWPVGNAGRHFLRTYLVAKDCPTVLINTLLGHWHVGELPWGDDSALDPYSFRTMVAPYVENVLDDLGYEALPI